MAKKRKTELDIDLDLNLDDLLSTEEPSEESKKEKIVDEEKEKKPLFKFKIPPKILILVAAGVLTLVLIGGIAFYFATKPKPVEKQEEVVKEEKEVVVGEEPAFVTIPQYQFTSFFFPLKTDNNQEVFLKIAFSCDMSNELVVKEIEQNVALLRANISFAMRKKTLSDFKADPNRSKLSQEIVKVLNRSLQKGTAKKVYFTQFLIN